MLLLLVALNVLPVYLLQRYFFKVKQIAKPLHFEEIISKLKIQ